MSAASVAPLLVSFTGVKDGMSSWGWVVVYCEPIRTAKDLNDLCDSVAKMRGYDPSQFVIISFQRLEAE